MKIIHISDLHFPKKIPYSSLRGKAIIGYINYRFRRKTKYPLVLIESLVKHIRNLEYDALVISGDLTNVSHPSEFEYAKEILAPILDERTFMIPGNHDRYQKKSIFPIPLFEKYFLPWMGDSLSSEFYIYQKKIGSKTFLGWDSNRALSITKANGYVDPKVIETSFKTISGDYVLVCHHPLWNPKGQIESEGHKFSNRREVVELLRKKPPLLYLHGHTHSNWVKLSGDKIPFPIVNSASSTRVSDKKHDCGFHFIELSKEIKIKRYTFKKNIFMETDPIFFKDEDGVV